MRIQSLLTKFAAVAAGLALATLSGGAAAFELVQNGGFESNGGAGTSTFANWTVVDQAGGSGSYFVQTGTTAPPLNPITVPVPPQGTFAAMSSQSGPGSHILYQDIAIPAGTSVQFSALVYVNNQAAAFATPASLDYTVSPNQQARIDIMDPAAPVDSVTAGVLRNVYQTAVGNPLVSGYTVVAADLSQFAGSTVRVRIAEVDNQSFFQFGVDAVSVSASAPVPTLGEWALVALTLMLAAAGVAALRRRGRPA